MEEDVAVDKFAIFATKGDLEAEADVVVRQADRQFKRSVKLYFIARYFVALFESRNGKIPIQVWNEYRNALDHFFRSQTGGGAHGHEADHLQKMEGHLQRAALDILKLLVHGSLDEVQGLLEAATPGALRLVDNGGFIVEIRARQESVKTMFSRAKISDSRLGPNASQNDEILDLYLDAAFAADDLVQNLRSKDQDIQVAESEYYRIHNGGRNLSYATTAVFVVMGILGGWWLNQFSFSFDSGGRVTEIEKTVGVEGGDVQDVAASRKAEAGEGLRAPSSKTNTN
jgi:hypothetical protein